LAASSTSTPASLTPASSEPMPPLGAAATSSTPTSATEPTDEVA
jgi:hypothetical protein